MPSHLTLGRISCSIIALIAVTLVGGLALAAEPASDLQKPLDSSEAAPAEPSSEDGKHPAKVDEKVAAKPAQPTSVGLGGPRSSNGIRLYRYGRATQVYGVH